MLSKKVEVGARRLAGLSDQDARLTPGMGNGKEDGAEAS